MSRALRLAGATARVLLMLAAAGFAAAALLLATALYALRAAPGDWALRVPIGPVDASLSVPALLRVASHPLGMHALDGRSLATRHGLVRAQLGASPASLVLRCAPCVVDARALAPQPVRFEGVELTVERGEVNRLHGELRIDGVRAGWRARLEPQSAQVELRLADTPVADLVALLGAAVPEAERARIEGTAGATVRLALPAGRYAVEPRLQGLRVEGLGTAALLSAHPVPACARAPHGRRGAPFGTWLPRAVVAAEDQRFHEHPGYDLAEMAAAWSDQAPERVPARRRGASTLSQQLAKMLYVGDERSVARKVRELLWAVELDRTLGKARVLQLYLAVVPWGDGQCGAEAAALHHLGKRAAALAPAEAVWLASLLRNPDAELDRAARGVDTARLAALGDAMRPMSRAQRETLRRQLEAWQPPPGVRGAARVVGAPP